MEQCNHAHNFGYGTVVYCLRHLEHEGDCIVRHPNSPVFFMVSKGGYATHPPFRILRVAS